MMVEVLLQMLHRSHSPTMLVELQGSWPIRVASGGDSNRLVRGGRAAIHHVGGHILNSSFILAATNRRAYYRDSVYIHISIRPIRDFLNPIQYHCSVFHANTG
jgi:hypothetical protein